MKGNKKNKTVLMVMLIMALSSVMFISPVAAQINVSIGDAEAYQDTTTTVQIIAHDVLDLGAFGLSLEYNSSVVTVTSAENNPLLPDVWDVTDLSMNDTGYVGIASSQLPPYPALSGAVVLTTVTLKAVGEPEEISPLNITLGKVYKPDGNTSIDAIDVDGTFSIATLTLSPTPTPSSKTNTHTSSNTPTPSPKPPGFEAVFTIAGLLAVAYMVLKKKRM